MVSHNRWVPRSAGVVSSGTQKVAILTPVKQLLDTVPAYWPGLSDVSEFVVGVKSLAVTFSMHNHNLGHLVGRRW
jgi:hypothetical protein